MTPLNTVGTIQVQSILVLYGTVCIALDEKVHVRKTNQQEARNDTVLDFFSRLDYCIAVPTAPMNCFKKKRCKFSHSYCTGSLQAVKRVDKSTGTWLVVQ